MSLVGRDAPRAMIKVGGDGAKLLLTMSTTSVLIVSRNPVLRVKAGIMNQGIRLSLGLVVAARTGKGLPVVGVLDFDIRVFRRQRLVVVDDVIVAVSNRISAVTRLLLLLRDSGIDAAADAANANADGVIARMNSRHVMQKCRLLDKTLVAVLTRVAELVPMTLDVVVHGVLACEGLVAAVVATDKVTLRVFRILNWHSFYR